MNVEQVQSTIAAPDIAVVRERLPELDALLAIGRKHLFDEMHAVHVTALSLSLFDQLTELHGLNGEDRRLLGMAALLHDIGTCFGYEKHHKTSLELIRTASIPGLDARDQLIVANVARYHRKKPPARKHKAFALLKPPDRERVVKLSSLLRMADALDCDHECRIRHLRVSRSTGGVRLSAETSADMANALASFKKKSVLFQETFRQDVSLARD
jgi:exopolyphosphatase / guanosine-5'-triphosphate,3'-diphosphate pyrophosphatase